MVRSYIPDPPANLDLELTAKERRRMGWPARLFFLALFFGSSIACVAIGEYVVAAALAVIGIASFGGYRTGATYMLGGLIAIGVTIMFAPSIGRAQEFRFAEWFGTTGLTNRLLSISVVGVVISLFVTLVLFTLAGRVLSRHPRVDTANRWLGFTIGGVEGAVAVFLFLGGLLILEPIERKRADTRDPLDIRGQFVSRWILNISAGVHESVLGPTIIAHNPFKTVPQLNKVREVQRTVQVLADPKQIDQLIHHPAIDRLKERPEMRRAIEQLNNDPDIKQILASGQQMDRTAAMTLMNHPAVLELIDQPGFMEEAYRVIRQSGDLP